MQDWFSEIDKDDLNVLSNERKELEDDEISAREAAFLDGYFDDDYWDEENL